MFVQSCVQEYTHCDGIYRTNNFFLSRDEKRIKLQLWDTAGQERYQAITTAYYHGAMGFIVMFDISTEASFQAVRNWLVMMISVLTSFYVILLKSHGVCLSVLCTRLLHSMFSCM